MHTGARIQAGQLDIRGPAGRQPVQEWGLAWGLEWGQAASLPVREASGGDRGRRPGRVEKHHRGRERARGWEESGLWRLPM